MDHKEQPKTAEYLITRKIQSDDPSAIIFPLTESEKLKVSQAYNDSFNFRVLTTPEEQKQMDYQQNLKYTQFLQSCDYRQHTYSDLINDSDEIITSLAKLTFMYDTVTKETEEFQKKSDSLLKEYTSIVKLGEDVKDELHYYEMLDAFTRKLNNPSPNIVRKESFRKMVEQLDECLKFVKDHPQHKEHEVFERRFKQCLIRSLTLIRNYIINNLKTVRDEINSKLSSAKSAVTQNALIYTRFGADCAFLKDVSYELCVRAGEDQEFQGLLNDCYNNYFSIRSKLISPLLKEQFQSHHNDKKPLVQHAQTNILFFTQVLENEFELFYKVFSTDSGNALRNWFQQLGEPLHDDLRNIILKETSIVSLTEMITLLNKYYEYEDDHFENEYDESGSTHEGERFENVDLGAVFEPILQDLQSRLVFRTQIFVEENIVKYKPSAKDFQIGARKHSIRDVTGADNELVSTAYSKTGLKDWYTPLEKGISLLSKIYELVSSSVFDDLAHHIVHDCIISLKQAYEVGVHAVGKFDADLFLLKNFLVLKERVQEFDIEYVSSETFLDFSGVGDIIHKISNGESVFKSQGLLGLVQESVPRVVKNMIDARQELQLELRNVVHIFTQDVVSQICVPIKEQEVSSALDDSRELRDNIEATLPRIKQQIELFIDDENVITALIDGIQELLVQNYEDYYHNLSSKVEGLVEVDMMIAFIGQIVAKMFESTPEFQTSHDLDKLAIEE